MKEKLRLRTFAQWNTGRISYEMMTNIFESLNVAANIGAKPSTNYCEDGVLAFPSRRHHRKITRAI